MSRLIPFSLAVVLCGVSLSMSPEHGLHQTNTIEKDGVTVASNKASTSVEQLLRDPLSSVSNREKPRFQQIAYRGEGKIRAERMKSSDIRKLVDQQKGDRTSELALKIRSSEATPAIDNQPS